MNNRGQVLFYALMIGLAIMILAIGLAPAIQNATQGAMNQSTSSVLGLGCSNTTNNVIKVTCLVTDIQLPYFIGFLLLLAGAIIGGKLIFQ